MARTFARLVLLTLIVVPLAYWLMGSGTSTGTTAQPVYAQPTLAQPQGMLPDLTFSELLSCERASWYNAPIGDGRRMYVPMYSGFQDEAAAVWSDMTDAERGAWLGTCGKVKP